MALTLDIGGCFRRVNRRTVHFLNRARGRRSAEHPADTTNVAQIWQGGGVGGNFFFKGVSMSAQKGYRSLGPALVAALSIVLSLAGPTRVGESANRGPR